MSSFVTVRDVLENVRSFRKQLKEFYRTLAETTDKRELQIYLAYMTRHEENFEKILSEHDGEGTNHKLDTWMQYGPENAGFTLPALQALDPATMCVEEAERLAITAETAILSYFTAAAKSVQGADPHALLEQLAEQQQSDIDILKQASGSLRQNA